MNYGHLYWETSSVVAAMRREDEFAAIIADTLSHCERQSVRLVLSWLSVCETAFPHGGVTPAEAQRQIDDFHDNPGVLACSVTKSIAVLARSLAENHKLDPYDAVHLATAIDQGCTLIEVADPKSPLLVLGTVGGVKVRQLAFLGTAPMFAEQPSATAVAEARLKKDAPKQTSSSASTAPPPPSGQSPTAAPKKEISP